jgi:biopolymer transport protein ExbB
MDMQWVCDHFYWLILLLAAGHLLLFARLWRARRLQAIWLADHLENLVQGLSSHADRDPYCTVDERIDSFLANVREVLDDPSRSADRRALHDKIVAKDESKKYLRGAKFETLYSVARTSIEMYPLLGIMGTVLAIGLALNAPSSAEAGLATERIVRNFAGSIWATLAGIGCGIVLLLVNSVVEPGFQRLLEHRWEVREVISAAKTQLGEAESQEVMN